MPADDNIALLYKALYNYGDKWAEVRNIIASRKPVNPHTWRSVQMLMSAL